MQIPPMYSALKVDGKKLYELAREGKEIERKPRPVTFYKIEILSMELPFVSMRVTCSKGTYIRTLCHDIGGKLGCKGCMESLLRTKVDRFTIENSLKLSEIEELNASGNSGKLQKYILSPESFFSSYPEVRAEKKFDKCWKMETLSRGRERSQEKKSEFITAGGFLSEFINGSPKEASTSPEAVFFSPQDFQ